MSVRKGPKPKPIAERFWSKVDWKEPADCWLWRGNKIPAGYGQFRVGGMADGTRRYKMAHRVAYELTKGEIPDGLVLDHLCRTPLCCNPDHLEPVNRGENVRRGKAGNPETNGGARFHRAKTHCRNGHAFSPENTYVNPQGHRSCRICTRDAGMRYQERRAT